MEIEEIKQQIKSNAKLETAYPPIVGGQSCGIFPSKVRLTSEELDLSIEFGYYKGSLKNKEKVLLLFELLIDEIVI